MNIVLGTIPEPDGSPMLFHQDIDHPLPFTVYIVYNFPATETLEDSFDCHSYSLFTQHKWALLRVCFDKLGLFLLKVKALGVEYTIGGKLRLFSDCGNNITQWFVPITRAEVRAYLGARQMA
jgi:hypothetical protein